MVEPGRCGNDADVICMHGQALAQEAIKPVDSFAGG